jgi:hypothetical protein
MAPARTRAPEEESNFSFGSSASSSGSPPVQETTVPMYTTEGMAGDGQSSRSGSASSPYLLDDEADVHGDVEAESWNAADGVHASGHSSAASTSQPMEVDPFSLNSFPDMPGIPDVSQLQASLEADMGAMLQLVQVNADFLASLRAQLAAYQAHLVRRGQELAERKLQVRERYSRLTGGGNVRD